MESITVSGAYGRDYKSKAAALADWNDGKDFMMRGMHSGYIGKAEAEAYNVKISIRYNKDTRVVIV